MATNLTGPLCATSFNAGDSKLWAQAKQEFTATNGRPPYSADDFKQIARRTVKLKESAMSQLSVVTRWLEERPDEARFTRPGEVVFAEIVIGPDRADPSRKGLYLRTDAACLAILKSAPESAVLIFEQIEMMLSELRKEVLS